MKVAKPGGTMVCAVDKHAFFAFLQFVFLSDLSVFLKGLGFAFTKRPQLFSSCCFCSQLSNKMLINQLLSKDRDYFQTEPTNHQSANKTSRYDS